MLEAIHHQRSRLPLSPCLAQVVGFVPTGWMYEMKRAPFSERSKGASTVHLVPYSEHSSYTELREYVRWVRPNKVVPTVGVEKGTGKEAERVRSEMLTHFRNLVDETASKRSFLSALGAAGGGGKRAKEEHHEGPAAAAAEAAAGAGPEIIDLEHTEGDGGCKDVGGAAAAADIRDGEVDMDADTEEEPEPEDLPEMAAAAQQQEDRGRSQQSMPPAAQGGGASSSRGAQQHQQQPVASTSGRSGGAAAAAAVGGAASALAPPSEARSQLQAIIPGLSDFDADRLLKLSGGSVEAAVALHFDGGPGGGGGGAGGGVRAGGGERAKSSGPSSAQKVLHRSSTINRYPARFTCYFQQLSVVMHNWS